MGFLGSKIQKLENGREVIVMPNSVNFIIVTADGKVILSKQARAGEMDKESINCFGGYIEEGEDYLQTFYRELKEETNINEDDINTCTMLYVNKMVSMGYTTERNTLIVATTYSDFRNLHLKCNDADENISFEVVDVVDVPELLGNIQGLKTYIGLMWIEEEYL